MKIMIATVYSYEPIIKSVISLGTEKLILIIDNNPNQEQELGINKIKETLSEYVEIILFKTKNYNLLEIIKNIVELIDNLNTNNLILNISSGRKTKALGLMYAGFCRKNLISRIIYVTKENSEILDLPILDIKITKNEKHLLLEISKNNVFNINDVRGKMNISKSQIYKILENLRLKGLVDQNNLITLSGEIYLLKND